MYLVINEQILCSLNSNPDKEKAGKKALRGNLHTFHLLANKTWVLCGI